MSIVSKAHSMTELLLSGQGRALWSSVRSHINSETISYGLRRDLTRELEAPAAKIPLRIRPLRPSDHVLFSPNSRTSEGLDLVNRKRILERRLGTCYAAVDEGDRVAYIQWLMFPGDNPLIRSHFNGLFPGLGDDSALLEGAFTFKAFRGLGVMAPAMAQIAEKAKDHGARYVITFVTQDNVASLKGCERAGFSPYCLRIERRRVFMTRISFRPLPVGARLSFEGGHARLTAPEQHQSPLSLQ